MEAEKAPSEPAPTESSSKLAAFAELPQESAAATQWRLLVHEVPVASGPLPAEHTAVVDRRTAISSALGMARPGDAVLIAGKGHEDYQIFADRTIHFDDREVAREELRALC